MTDTAALSFLLNRRSRPAAALTGPAPDRATMTTLLTAAARVPDHGKLEPWRFVVIGPEARPAMVAALSERGKALDVAPEKLDKVTGIWLSTPALVAVVSVPRPVVKVPVVEQVLSAGAVCMGLVNAAEAMGLGACWLTGWQAFDRPFVEGALGLAPEESIAGFIHIGHCATPVPDRPRPDLGALTTWMA